ncbi:MAG TPA: helix-turn-helix domain-containing protein [Gemmatimonadota bacterium]|nr:helix-turn-helix domain-containing protein [Gemmatimonadota bacterium]
MSPERLPEGTKRALLDLVVRQEQTAEQLAEQLGVSATAVRQHLGTLAGLGLVERRKAGTRGGRPAFLYRLSDLGRRAYPKRHDLLVLELVSTLMAREGEERTLEIVTEAAQQLARKVEGEVGSDSTERLAAIAAWLEEEFAWEADVERTPGGGLRFVVHRCPFQAVSAVHPSVCGAFFRALLEGVTHAGPFGHRPLGDGVCCCALETLSEKTSD